MRSVARRTRRETFLEKPERLIEREHELLALEFVLDRAHAGAGAVALIEGPAGTGKSELLAAAGVLAENAGLDVLAAQGTDAESDFRFSLAIGLLEARWRALDPNQRALLLEGPARRAGEMLVGALPETSLLPSDDAYSLIHGLFSLTRNLVAESDDELPGSLAILVDDVNWADLPSLRFLAYLGRRVNELPIAVIATVRSDEPSADRTAISALRHAAGEQILRPDHLSEEGVAAVVRTAFPEAEPAFWQGCAQVSGGNPFLLVELLRALSADHESPDSVTAGRLGEVAPQPVISAVRSKLEGLPAEAERIAAAVAVLGDQAGLHHVSQVANLDDETVSHLAEAMSVKQILEPSLPLAFVNPMTRSAINASMSILERGRVHRRAADLLMAEHASDERIAPHLLEAPPVADPRCVEVLRATARKAFLAGEAETAVRMLERALAEPPSAEGYADVLGELAQARSAAVVQREDETPRQITVVSEERRSPARLALTEAHGLRKDRRYREAADVIATALDGLGDGDQAFRGELQAAYIGTALSVPELAEQARDRGQEILAHVEQDAGAAERSALAHMAAQAGLRGESRALVLEMTDLAWGAGELMTLDSPEVLPWTLLAGGLLFVDELERALAICDAALAATHTRRLETPYAAARSCRSWLLYEQGRIGEAAAEAQAALNAQPEEPGAYLRTAYGALASCHLQQGQLARAETALAGIEHPDVQESINLAFLLDVRAQLRFAQLRPRDALRDALAAGHLLQRDLGVDNPGVIAWRSTAALAHLALGESDPARELAAEELEHARRIGVTRVAIRDLRVLGLAERGQPGIDLLTQAVDLGGRYPDRLEHVLALLDLGAALRRANQRAAARDPLRRALERATSGGAETLAERARRELAATGLRARHAMGSGTDALTPSESRVGELAAQGLTTRQIAETLFVTPKTVEFHLRGIYRKLDISSRSELAEMMGEEASG